MASNGSSSHKPTVLTPTADGLTEGDLCAAAEALRAGGLIAFPTDTVYGVAAHAGEPASVLRLYQAKGRPLGKALPLLIAGAEDLPCLARGVPPVAFALAERFWPGPLTMVLRRTDAVCPEAVAGGDTVGLRVPDSRLARAILRAADVPVAVTSANPSGGPETVEVAGVLRTLGRWLAVAVDSPGPGSGLPSTVIDLTSSPPAILRIGAVTREQLDATVGTTQLRGPRQ